MDEHGLEQKKNQRWGNIKAQLADGGVRLRYGSGLVIMLGAASIGYFMLHRAISARPAEPSQFATVPNVTALAEPLPLSQLSNATPAYDNLLANQNAATAAAAKQTGESALPVMRPKAVLEPSLTMPSQPVVEPLPFATAQLNLQNTIFQSSQEGERRQQAIAAKTAAMRNQVNLLMTAWQPKEHTSLALPARQMSQTASLQNDLNPQQTYQPSRANAADSQSESLQLVLRAGDVSYAVLDTAINSDEPGPVTATIVQGTFNGAKLLGKIEIGQNAQKAGLHFNLMSLPTRSKSIAIEAWAIDPETARTALASNVDHHYLMRYGTFFAASFLGGFSEALLKGGQRQQWIANPLNPFSSTIQQDPYTKQQLLLAGVGNVGKQVSQNLTGLLSRPATITINAGIGIGVLFMNDLTLPPR